MKTPMMKIFPSLLGLALVLCGILVCGSTFGQEADRSKKLRAMQSQDRVGGNEITALMRQPHIKRDLELTQDQIDQVNQLRQQHDAAVKEMMVEYRERVRDMEPEQRREFLKGLSEKRKQNQKEMDERLEEVLLPFQVKRIEQIKIQQKLERMKQVSGSAILHPVIRAKLEFDEEQQARIKKKMAEVKKKLDEDIAELRKKANEEILQELTDEQRKIYDELLGEPLRKDDNEEK